MLTGDAVKSHISRMPSAIEESVSIGISMAMYAGDTISCRSCSTLFAISNAKKLHELSASTSRRITAAVLYPIMQRAALNIVFFLGLSLACLPYFCIEGNMNTTLSPQRQEMTKVVMGTTSWNCDPWSRISL